MEKKLFKNSQNNFHFGVNPPSDDFQEITNKEEAKEALKALRDKKLWRCNVCNDVHLGINFPHKCPTCNAIDAYVEISEQEFLTILG